MYLQKLFDHFKHKTYTSAVNEPIRVGMSFGRKAIFAGKIPQSGGEFIFEWDTVISLIKDRGYELKNCLMLGVAGGTAINSLQKFYPQIRILGIELDPVILKVSLEHKLFTVNKKTQLKIADGINWVEKDSNKYDLIVVDLYLGDQNVKEAREEKFLNRVKNLLTKNGIILYSCHYSSKKRVENKEFVELLKKLFSEVEVVFKFPKNKILLLER